MNIYNTFRTIDFIIIIWMKADPNNMRGIRLLIQNSIFKTHFKPSSSRQNIRNFICTNSKKKTGKHQNFQNLTKNRMGKLVAAMTDIFVSITIIITIHFHFHFFFFLVSVHIVCAVSFIVLLFSRCAHEYF